MPEREPTAPREYRGAELPAGLVDLADPPATLYVTGAWPETPLVAIVGARAATTYGLDFAHRLAGDLVRLGFGVVSGLARGIDAAAHEGTLDAGGTTVAILPGSLDPVTPASHAALARRIARDGALAAEWASGVPAARGLFLRRNRLIAAVARATVVVEAAERSGALSTAGVARRLGRPVLAVPGDVDRVSSRGCHALLRHGARVCEGAGDVLEALAAESDPSLRGSVGSHRTAHAPEAAPASSPRSGASARVAAALDAEPRGLDRLAERAGVPPDHALAALLELEWAGVARAHPGARWTSRRATKTP